MQGSESSGDEAPQIRRLNKLPIVVFVGLMVTLGIVIIYGLANRGLSRRPIAEKDAGALSAQSFADRLKAGISNGVIEDRPKALPRQLASNNKPQEKSAEKPFNNPFQPQPAHQSVVQPQQTLETEKDWRHRLARQQEEQVMGEKQRQKMKRLQSADAALDSPIAINLKAGNGAMIGAQSRQLNQRPVQDERARLSAADYYSAALQSANGGGATADPNGQAGKQRFFGHASFAKAGYLDKGVVFEQSAYALKRGSIIPATLITGIKSDLPGRISAQVRENVYDSATGHELLIPQGAKLLGRYDSNVSFGQSRVLVIWTDLIFPNGSTLQLGGMAGTDTEGYGGFNDQVDNHYLKVFGSAVLVALIGTGIDMATPRATTAATSATSAAEAAKASFADVFGRLAEKTVSKNLDVQPTLEIRPGYNFSVLVDQDIIFPGTYRG